MLLPFLAGFALLIIFGLPLLPKVSILRAPFDPPEFMFASAWYYLPKSADILFQQTLAARLILTAANAGYRLRQIMIGMALAFDGFTPTYVIRFTCAATLFGALLPYLYLQAHHGFRWAYALHS